jgi:TetR/AcrR family transcriptional regulator, copper-responsive repressor
MAQAQEKRRGRPRKFDPQVAIARATETFLQRGYSGASVEQLAHSMQLNKPSLYAAFGDKRGLYLSVLRARIRALSHRYHEVVQRGSTLEEALRALFDEAVKVSLGDNLPPGCLIASPSTTEALNDDAIREFTREFFAVSDKTIATWLRPKCRAGALSADAIARLANSVIHDMALRARVGEPAGKLFEIARDAATALAHAGDPR